LYFCRNKFQNKYRMNSSLSSKKIFTLLVAASILHNAEEALTMPFYNFKIPVSIISSPTYNQFLLAVSILTILVIMFYIIAIWSRRQTVYLFISTAFAAAVLFNAFFPHILVSLFTLKYSPGLFTAVFLVVPTSLLTMRKNILVYPSQSMIVIHIITGLAAGYAIFAVTMMLAKQVL
jgi:hypothetical protein